MKATKKINEQKKKLSNLNKKYSWCYYSSLIILNKTKQNININ